MSSVMSDSSAASSSIESDFAIPADGFNGGRSDGMGQASDETKIKLKKAEKIALLGTESALPCARCIKILDDQPDNIPPSLEKLARECWDKSAELVQLQVLRYPSKVAVQRSLKKRVRRFKDLCQKPTGGEERDAKGQYTPEPLRAALPASAGAVAQVHTPTRSFSANSVGIETLTQARVPATVPSTSKRQTGHELELPPSKQAKSGLVESVGSLAAWNQAGAGEAERRKTADKGPGPGLLYGRAPASASAAGSPAPGRASFDPRDQKVDGTVAIESLAKEARKQSEQGQAVHKLVEKMAGFMEKAHGDMAELAVTIKSLTGVVQAMNANMALDMANSGRATAFFSRHDVAGRIIVREHDIAEALEAYAEPSFDDDKSDHHFDGESGE
ncbi:MAG: hypothetical protein M1832_002320 [Thelocarpon impressellum]|nr:MAG: hypothetical protein M1832_002320 [Thelocarpon impressellum]